MKRRDQNRQEDFVRGVMARTSGPACGRALVLLPELTDRALPDVDRRLVQQHLEHCAGCRDVAVVMGWLGTEMADMAELDPGPAFTAAVVARTTGVGEAAHQRRRAQVAGSGPAGLMDRIGRWWERRIMMPGFATQVAYVATVLAVLLVATPGSPLRSAPRQALTAVQASPTGLPLVGPAAVWTFRTVEDQSARAAAGLNSGAKSRWQGLRGGWDTRVQRSGPARGRAGTHLQAAFRNLGDLEPGRAVVELTAAGREIRAAWRFWWNDSDTTDGP